MDYVSWEREVRSPHHVANEPSKIHWSILSENWCYFVEVLCTTTHSIHCRRDWKRGQPFTMFAYLIFHYTYFCVASKNTHLKLWPSAPVLSYFWWENSLVTKGILAYRWKNQCKTSMFFSSTHMYCCCCSLVKYQHWCH